VPFPNQINLNSSSVSRYLGLPRPASHALNERLRSKFGGEALKLDVESGYAVVIGGLAITV
jgi:hypothetical protein